LGFVSYWVLSVIGFYQLLVLSVIGFISYWVLSAIGFYQLLGFISYWDLSTIIWKEVGKYLISTPSFLDLSVVI
jgi:hypothetical protein